MRILHRNGLEEEIMSFRQIANLFRVIVCHQKIPDQLRSQLKQCGVVDFRMAVKTTARFCVGRIDEIDDIFPPGVTATDLKSVSLNERNPFFYPINRENSPFQRSGIPAGRDAFPVFTFFDETGPIRQNAAPIDAIFDNRRECLLF